MHNKYVNSRIRIVAKKVQFTKNASVLQYLCECSEEIFPNIFKLLKILAILPVSTSTVERPFSTLKYLKNYLRSTTAEDQLNGLALLYIYRDMSTAEEEIFNILQEKREN